MYYFPLYSSDVLVRLRDIYYSTLNGIEGNVLDIGTVDARTEGFYSKNTSLTFLDKLPGNSRVIKGDVKSIPFPDLSFDCVTFSFLLCSVDDPSKAVSEILRVLKPNGRIVILEHIRSRKIFWHLIQRIITFLFKEKNKNCTLHNQNDILFKNELFIADKIIEIENGIERYFFFDARKLKF